MHRVLTVTHYDHLVAVRAWHSAECAASDGCVLFGVVAEPRRGQTVLWCNG